MSESGSIHELLSFLGAPRADVRALAVQHLLSLTVTEARPALCSPVVLKRLQDMTMLDPPTAAHDAVKALINLSSDVQVQSFVGGDTAYLRWMVEAIISPNGLLSDPLAMLLSNLTKSESVCAALLAMRMSAAAPMHGDGTALSLLVDVFIEGDRHQLNKNASFHFLASVLANVSATSNGRRAVLSSGPGRPNSSSCPLARISAYTEHPDTIRRGGIASAIKNCCFDRQAHLDICSEERWNVLPRILLPLCGPEEFDIDDLDSLPEECQLLGPDKSREVDAHIRLIHIEALLLLSSSPVGRSELRRRNVYRIIQLLHKTEHDSQVKEGIERLVNFLQREEHDDVRLEELPNGEDFTVQEV